MGRKMGRRILAAVVALCLFVGECVWLTDVEVVRAETLTSSDGNFEYQVLDEETGTVEITKYKGVGGNVKIPGEIDGKRVVGIGYGVFKGCTGLTAVAIPDGVTSIGNHAFGECTSLTSIAIPASVTSIGEWTFDECTGLETIAIPDEVTSIGSHAFYGCTGLKTVEIPSSVASIEDSTFRCCTGLTIVAIPSSVTRIGGWAFAGCTGLTAIDIPKVTSIEDCTFTECVHLKDVYYFGTEEEWKNIVIGEWNEGVHIATIHFNSNPTDKYKKNYEWKTLANETIEITKYIGSDTTANIPKEIEGKLVTSIGANAFKNCKELTTIDIPNSVNDIGEYAFYGCSELTAVNIPKGVTSIENSVFAGCHKLAIVDIPDSVTSIGAFAFSECYKWVAVDIPKGVTSIGIYAFSHCDMQKIDIPNGVASIGAGAFFECHDLKDVYYLGTEEEWNKIVIGNDNERLLNATIHFYSNSTDNLEKDYEWNTLADETIEITKYIGSDAVANIPKAIDGKSVTRIGEEAFCNCINLTSVEIPNSVTSIGQDAFGECTGLISVEIPGSVTSIGGAAFQGCTSLTAIEIPSSVTRIVHHMFLGCTGLTVVEIPASVTSIDPFAFSGCIGLTAIEIPSSVTDILNYAFHGCTGLTSVEIPEGVTRIWDGTFRGCTGLKEVGIPNSVIHIGPGAFFECTGLTAVEIPNSVSCIDHHAFAGCTGLTTIKIPNRVTIIKRDTFNRCTGLERVDIPDSIAQIEESAFIDCTDLKDVYYSGTKEQWNKIEIDADGNETLLNATMHFKEEVILPTIVDPKQELEKLKDRDALSLENNFQQFLSDEQIDIIESCIYTWLAEINYAYKYTGDTDIKNRIMKKAGIDPDGDFASGKEQAITHISVWTKYGPKTLEITLDLGKPDRNGDLYPFYGEMHYKILEKQGFPSNVPASGQIGRDSCTDMGSFINSVAKSAEDSLHSTFHWQELEGWMAANILTDRTISEIIGNKNGCFVNGTYIVYAKHLFAYSKKVTIACPVDVHVYSMDGTEAGSIINNEPKGGNENVQLDVDGDTKIVYLAGDDYYLNLCGMDTGTMKYEVEEIANEEVQRNVQFLELQLKKDMQYEGYVFRPLNIDSDLYALRTVGSDSQEVFYANEDKQHQALSLFKRVEGLTLGQGSTSMDEGKTLQMRASVSPLDASNPELQWTVDNESVARVDSNGMVTAVGAGSARVTVSTKDGSFIKQYCIIDVAGSEPIVKPDDNPDINPGGSPGTNPGGSTDTNPGGNISGNPGGSTSVTPGNDNTDNTNPGSTTKPPLEQEPSIVSLSYVLQFNVNGGTGLSRATMTLLAGDCPGIMPKAKRKGYTFDGWYTQQKGGMRISGDKPLEEAATLYAQWTKVAAPAKASAPTLKSKKKGQVKVGLKKVAGAAGYQIEYSTSKKFTSAKTKTAGASAKVKTLTGLKAGKKYYVRVRAYKVDSTGSRIYGAYSAVKSVNVKKK